MARDARRDSQFRAIRAAVARHGLQGTTLTASEIYDLVRDEDVGLSSAHEVATVLGQHADEPDLTVEEGSPYRYEFSNL